MASPAPTGGATGEAEHHHHHDGEEQHNHRHHHHHHGEEEQHNHRHHHHHHGEGEQQHHHHHHGEGERHHHHHHHGGEEHDHHHDHGGDHPHRDGSSGTSWVGTDGRVYHSHDGLAPHSHEPIYSPGFFSKRAPPLLTRDFRERAFTVGIGGPVGTGKTALMLALCKFLREKYSLAAVTNDIFTKEDAEFLVKNGALPEERIRAVETGGCPHAAIREDISINLGPLEELSNLYKTDILLCESGEVLFYSHDPPHPENRILTNFLHNLAANFSRELADYIIYIIDVSGGDKIPRKGGPGITQADLLVINKTDLAAAVGADLAVMERDALRMRDGGPFVFAQVKHGVGVAEIVDHILQSWAAATGKQRR